ncbi:ABC transporter substrate-binding protein [Labrys monachus]|uniref:Peptide/nickel transport system substrate-binding protein n=1 Tax=Labrys monachus TaxID=217067 RepID=A0ABU0FNL5_9HYPH|nr:ABC transporter substrate-binding protein [Labrys monachus]MDQ0396203.1 peptide/nickel transport system substrate-binding protein [Labrys monachus]
MKFGVAGGATSDTLDPRGSPDTHVALAWWALRNSLTEVMPDGSLVGELAASWAPSDEAKTWTFQIRNGVTFHDGKPLTAEDVVASINFHRGDKSVSAGKTLVEPIADIKATGPLTVVVELSKSNADFPFLMSDYHMLILPVVDGKVDWQSGNGTGGYVLESFEPGVSIKLKRNPNYFKGDSRAHFDQVELINIPDAAARQTALMSGEVDAIGRVDVKTVLRLGGVPGIRIVETTGPQYSTILMDTTSSLFRDKDVRLAFKYAVDREEMLKRVLLGHGTIGNDQPIGPTYPYFDKGLAQRSYDPDKAKFLLKKAGAEGITVDLETAEVAWPAGAIDAAVLYAEQAKAAGIRINVVKRPNDGFWSNTWSKVPFTMGYVGGRPTEDWIFTAFYAAKAENNDTHWDNPHFEDLLVKGRLTVDPAERRAVYAEMQHLLNEDGGLIAPLFANHIVGLGSKVTTPEKLSGNWEMDNWRAVERWSLSA